MKISPARIAAFDILLRIERDSAFSSILLPQHEASLEPRDRGLCHELVLGVLRRQIYLDRLIDLFVQGKKLDLEVRIAMRIGLFQILFLDKIPAFSAVNDSVSLVHKARKGSAKGLVNAVLRKTAKDGVPDIDLADEIERISVETSHPRWLVEKWAKEFGIAEAGRLAAANNEQPGIVFRATLKKPERNISSYGTPSDVVPGAFVSRSFSAELRSAAERGEIYFQDAGSQLVARSVKIQAGERFLDVCAAPGSKTTYIAAESGKSSTFIAAGDVNRLRTLQLLENCRRQGADSVAVCQFDVRTALPFADRSFDAVLVDAPCSGTGTIRHNPEIRYFLDPKDLAELSNKQLAILTNASKLVKPKGRLIYSTCSIETEENEEVVGRFLSENSDFSPAEPDVPEKFRTSGGFARTFPQRDNLDGFFISEFRRR
jgi:16S rRNA (cytosine967-C5)-methyltransferase